MENNLFGQYYSNWLENCSISQALKNGGSISMQNQIIRLPKLASSEKENDELLNHLLKSIFVHELFHYYQLIGTSDGIDEMLSTSYWIDSLVDDLKNNDNQNVQIPIVETENPYFKKSRLRFLYNKVIRQGLFFSNFEHFPNAELYKTPILTVKDFDDKNEKIQIKLNSRFLYEGQARSNEIMANVYHYGLDKSTELYNTIPMNWHYDWGTQIELDILSFIAIIDLALMRPINNHISNKNIDFINPSLRFLKIYDFVVNNEYYLKSIEDVFDYQNNICEALGFQKPKEIAETILSHLALFINTTTYLQSDIIKNHKPADRYKVASNPDSLKDIDLDKIVDKKFVNAFKIMRDRKNESSIKSIFPAFFISELFQQFTPPQIFIDGKLVQPADSKLSSFDIGHASYFTIKMINAEQLFSEKRVECISKIMNVDCEDIDCPGIFPNNMNYTPDCYYAKGFKRTFRLSVDKIE